MIIIKRLLFLLILLTLLSSCSETELQQLEERQKALETAQKIFTEKNGSQEIYDEIQVGMTMDEVKEIAGEPLKRTQIESEYGKTEIWYYEGKIQVMFREDYVQSKSKY